MGNHSAALFLDITKAFDSIWHRGLLYKLKLLECPAHLIWLIRAYLMNRTFQVRVNGCLSTIFHSEQGVPQGSPLATLLSKVYLFDIYNHNPKHFDKNLYVLQFADDHTLISHNKTLRKTIDNLQLLQDSILTWFNTWRLRINSEKSQFVIFHHNITPNWPTPTLLAKIVPNT